MAQATLDPPDVLPGAPSTPVPVDQGEPRIRVAGLDFFYGEKQALFGIDLAVPADAVTAFIGPSGCGKSTLLRCLNRMNDLVAGAWSRGAILLDGEDIRGAGLEVEVLRRRVGMVFQKPNPFPKSIFDNIAYGPRIHGEANAGVLEGVVETCLRRAALWEEVKDRLEQSALGLSGGQQQRLCIARALATSPGVLLMDEPCSALDPISTGKIEDLIHELRGTCTIVIVTHNMQQAGRVSDRTAFFLLGKMVEDGPTEGIFTRPLRRETEDYVTGRFG